MTKTIGATIVAKAIRNPDRERYDVTDGLQPGLVLRVTETAASWVVRSNAGRKNRRITLGPARAIDVGLARRLAQAVHDVVASGREPDASWLDDRLVEAGLREERVVPPEPTPADPSTWTYGEAVQRYLDGIRPKPAKETLTGYRNVLMGPHLRPLSDRPLVDVTRREMSILIREVYEKGLEASSHAIARQVSMLWGFAHLDAFQAQSGLTENVMAALKAPRRGDEGMRKTRSPEIGAMARLVAICRAGVFHPTLAAALELATLTAQRRLTVASTRVSDVEERDGVLLWVIGAASMKGKLEHVLPTTPRMATILSERVELAGDRGFLFPQIKPARTGADMGHISAHTLTGRLIDLPCCAFTPHDVRRSFTSLMESLGEIKSELILDHREGRRTTKDRNYNRYQYLPQKAAMLNAWGDAIETAVVGIEIDVDEVRAGLRAAHAHRNRNRQKTPRPLADDDDLTAVEVVEEWARGAMDARTATVLARVSGVADLRRIASEAGIEVRR